MALINKQLKKNQPGTITYWNSSLGSVVSAGQSKFGYTSVSALKQSIDAYNFEEFIRKSSYSTDDSKERVVPWEDLTFSSRKFFCVREDTEFDFINYRNVGAVLELFVLQARYPDAPNPATLVTGVTPGGYVSDLHNNVTGAAWPGPNAAGANAQQYFPVGNIFNFHLLWKWWSLKSQETIYIPAGGRKSKVFSSQKNWVSPYWYVRGEVAPGEIYILIRVRGQQVTSKVGASLLPAYDTAHVGFQMWWRQVWKVPRPFSRPWEVWSDTNYQAFGDLSKYVNPADTDISDSSANVPVGDWD